MSSKFKKVAGWVGSELFKFFVLLVAIGIGGALGFFLGGLFKMPTNWATVTILLCAGICWWLADDFVKEWER